MILIEKIFKGVSAAALPQDTQNPAGPWGPSGVLIWGNPVSHRVEIIATGVLSLLVVAAGLIVASRNRRKAQRQGATATAHG